MITALTAIELCSKQEMGKDEHTLVLAIPNLEVKAGRDSQLESIFAPRKIVRDVPADELILAGSVPVTGLHKHGDVRW